jgi:membrane protein implicated in regulation of membrane protease activity
MNWETFYLVAFLIGFLLSAISFFSGVFHIPHFHMHGHVHTHAGGRGGLSPFNFGTIAAFLAWFGGTGYILERYSSIWIYLALFIAILSGIAGAGVIFWFLLKLAAQDRPLDPADYEMTGVLGKVSSPIRSGGTGELIYSRQGSRCASPARSENGAAIPRDSEVVVTRFEKGIAYVRPWDEMTNEKLANEKLEEEL